MFSFLKYFKRNILFHLCRKKGYAKNCKICIMLITLKLILKFWLIIRNASRKHCKWKNKFRLKSWPCPLKRWALTFINNITFNENPPMQLNRSCDCLDLVRVLIIPIMSKGHQCWCQDNWTSFGNQGNVFDGLLPCQPMTSHHIFYLFSNIVKHLMDFSINCNYSIISVCRKWFIICEIGNGWVV